MAVESLIKWILLVEINKTVLLKAPSVGCMYFGKLAVIQFFCLLIFYEDIVIITKNVSSAVISFEAPYSHLVEFLCDF